MTSVRRFDEAALLDRAEDLFWSHGYDRTSLADVSEASGVGNGSIYAAYGSKLSLFLAAFAVYCHGRAEVVRLAVGADHLSTRDAVERFFATVIADCVSQPGLRGCLLLNSVVDLSWREPEVAELCRSTNAAMEQRLADRLDAGVLAGGLDAGPDSTPTLAAQIVLVSQGLIQSSRLGVPRDRLVDVAAATTAMLPWGGDDADSDARSSATRIGACVSRLHRLQGPFCERLGVLDAAAEGREIGAQDPLHQRLQTAGSSAAPEPAGDTGAPSLRAEARRLVDAHLGDEHLSPAHLAARLGVSVRTLHAAFEGDRTTVGRLILDRRLDEARIALETADQTVAGLAHRLGFRSASHFTRAFGRRFGCPPSRWRATLDARTETSDVVR